jgi:hypothetical protein
MKSPSSITDLLCQLIVSRDAVGFKKYGVTLDRKDLSIEEWLDHATEEALDEAGYLQCAKREITALRLENMMLTEELRRLKAKLGGSSGE